jgi:hypothetical protein
VPWDQLAHASFFSICTQNSISHKRFEGHRYVFLVYYINFFFGAKCSLYRTAFISHFLRHILILRILIIGKGKRDASSKTATTATGTTVGSATTAATPSIRRSVLKGS